MASKKEEYEKQMELFSRSFHGTYYKLLDDLQENEKRIKELEGQLKEHEDCEARLKEYDASKKSFEEEIKKIKQECDQQKEILYKELMDKNKEAKKFKEDYMNAMKKWETEAAENEAIKKDIDQMAKDLETFRKKANDRDAKEKIILQLEKSVENLKKENSSVKAALEESKKELSETEESLSKTLELRDELQAKVVMLTEAEESWKHEKIEYNESEHQLLKRISLLEKERDDLTKDNQILRASMKEKANELMMEKQTALVHKAKIYLLASDIRQEYKSLENKFMEVNAELEKLRAREKDIQLQMPRPSSAVEATSGGDGESMPGEVNSTSKEEEISMIEKMCGTDEFAFLKKEFAVKDVQTEEQVEPSKPEHSDASTSPPSSPKKSEQDTLTLGSKLIVETPKLVCENIGDGLRLQIIIPYCSQQDKSAKETMECDSGKTNMHPETIGSQKYSCETSVVPETTGWSKYSAETSSMPPETTGQSRYSAETSSMPPETTGKRKYSGECVVSSKQLRTGMSPPPVVSSISQKSSGWKAEEMDMYNYPVSSSCLSEDGDTDSVSSIENLETPSSFVRYSGASKKTRDSFTEIVTSMRVLDFSKVTPDGLAQVKESLSNCMQRMQQEGGQEFVLDLVMNYVLCRQSEISFHPENRVHFGASEKCIAEGFLKILLTGSPELSEGYLQRFIDLVRCGERCTLYGYASACILYAEICRGASNRNNMRMIFYELLMNHKDIAPFLFACMLLIYPDAQNFAESERPGHWMAAVMTHLISRKPKVMSSKMWKECLQVLTDVGKLPDRSSENPESLLDRIMSSIKEKSNERPFPKDLGDDYLLSVLLLASHYGKHWTTEKILQKHILPFRKSCEAKKGCGQKTTSALIIFDRLQAWIDGKVGLPRIKLTRLLSISAVA